MISLSFITFFLPHQSSVEVVGELPKLFPWQENQVGLHTQKCYIRFYYFCAERVTMVIKKSPYSTQLCHEFFVIHIFFLRFPVCPLGIASYYLVSSSEVAISVFYGALFSAFDPTIFF